MDLDDLKPLWKSHKEQVDEQDLWSEAQISALLQRQVPKGLGYPRSGRVLLNLCLLLFSVSFSGC